jgi:seryl-tRNA synthetase
MLSTKSILENKEQFITGLSKRYKRRLDEIFLHIETNEQKRKVALSSLEEKKAKLNLLSGQIGKLLKEGNKDAAEGQIKQVQLLKEDIKQLQETYDKLADDSEKIIIALPNIPHHSVPAGKNAADNLNIKEAGAKPVLYENAVPHWDLIKQYDLIDFETGAKITGSGFPLYKGKGAKLQRALIQYFLDFNTAAGYTEYLPPLMVNEATAYGTGQLPDKEGQMYFMPADNYYLIPTAEVPVTNIYRDEILKQEQLPIKMTAYTPCFRREAGSFGADVRGLNRLHQFDKIEIVQMVQPENSYTVLEEMANHVEQLLISLELPYRKLLLCGGDMSFASAKTYDFEV